MRRSVIPRWPTAFWIGWFVPRTGSNYRGSRCARSGAAAAPKIASRRRVAKCFWALTPVALRAPSVSAQKHSSQKAIPPGIPDKEKCVKLLTDVDHCFTLREPCVASLRTDRHQIGMTDRHHWNAHVGHRVAQGGQPKGGGGAVAAELGRNPRHHGAGRDARVGAAA